MAERAHPHAQAPMAPPQMFDSFFGPSWDMQPHGGHGGMFGDGLFGMVRGMMSSVDRMFDDMAASAAGMNDRGQPSGTFYYESKTRTVGPDGIVREETVRTAPGADGRPETRRTVREGDGAPGAARFGANGYGAYGDQRAMPRMMDDYRVPHVAHEPDVVIEELDEYGNVVASNDSNSDVRQEDQHYFDERDRRERYEMPHEMNEDRPQSWWQDRYRQWRGNNA